MFDGDFGLLPYPGRLIFRIGPRGSDSIGTGPGKVNARLEGCSAGPTFDCVGVVTSAGSPAGAASLGPAVAISEAVTVGAVVVSTDPRLERLVGLVCMVSAVTLSGMVMLFATRARGSLISVAAFGACVLLLMADPELPSREFSAWCAGFGLILVACCSRCRRSSSIAAAPVSGEGVAALAGSLLLGESDALSPAAAAEVTDDCRESLWGNSALVDAVEAAEVGVLGSPDAVTSGPDGGDVMAVVAAAICDDYCELENSLCQGRGPGLLSMAR